MSESSPPHSPHSPDVPPAASGGEGQGLGRHRAILGESPYRRALDGDLPESLARDVAGLRLSVASVRVWQQVRYRAGGLDRPVVITVQEIADALSLKEDKVRRWQALLIASGHLSLSVPTDVAQSGRVAWTAHDPG